MKCYESMGDVPDCFRTGDADMRILPFNVDIDLENYFDSGADMAPLSRD
tara:strand:+ start:326 stop:472 length:147 start_codon:yes stop_codon:yes gene_type:complete